MSQNPYESPAAPVRDAEAAPGTIASLLVRCWRGEAPLWQAFWIVLFGGYVLLMALTMAAGFAAASFAATDAVLVVAMVLALLSFIQNIYGLVSVWRCAPNTESPAFKVIARLIVVLTILAFLYNLYSGFLKGRQMVEGGPAGVVVPEVQR